MQSNAALTYGDGVFEIEQVELGEMGPTEVLLEIKAVGICHTDIAASKGIYPFEMPAILGHEGAGIVMEAGEESHGFQPGDHVIVSYASCGECPRCKEQKPYICKDFYRLNVKGLDSSGSKKIKKSDGTMVSNFFGQSSFSEYIIADVKNLIKVPKDIPLELLGPLACGIQTGMGVVLEKMKPAMESSIIIFGCGTVGLSAIIAAKIQGCHPIIAVDVNEAKLEFAKAFGATHSINSKDRNVQEEVRNITEYGCEYAIESTGIPAILQETINALSIPGTCAVLSATNSNTEVNLLYKALQSERTIMGSVMGSVNPQEFVPKMIDYYRQGILPLEKLITYYDFKDVNQAVEDIEAGAVIKAVLKLN